MPRQSVSTESEKLTTNLGVVDLGQVDLLVEDGFYSNRADFIRTAVRNQLAVHADQVKGTIKRRLMAAGIVRLSRKDLEKQRAERKMLELRVVGLLSIDREVSADLAAATIQSLEVRGVTRASAAVKAALSDRTI